jgi:hypothetical protein
MTRLESSKRKQRIEGNPRQVVGWTNTFKINLLIPRKRSRPQLACPVHYKYRAPVFIIHHLSSCRESQICAGSCSFGAQVSGRAGKWCASFWVGSSVQLSFYFLLGALASLGYWIATRILFLVKVKVLGGWLRPVVG